MAVLQFIQDFWGLFVAALATLAAKGVIDRVVKSFTQDQDIIKEELEEIKEELKAMKAKDFVPRYEAEQMVDFVRAEHTKMFNEQTRQHEQQREDFKHLVNRIDDVYELLSKKGS